MYLNLKLYFVVYHFYTYYELYFYIPLDLLICTTKSPKKSLKIQFQYGDFAFTYIK